MNIKFCGLLLPTPPPFTVCAFSLFEVVVCDVSVRGFKRLTAVVYRRAEFLIRSTPPFTVCARSRGVSGVGGAPHPEALALT